VIVAIESFFTALTSLKIIRCQFGNDCITHRTSVITVLTQTYVIGILHDFTPESAGVPNGGGDCNPGIYPLLTIPTKQYISIQCHISPAFYQFHRACRVFF
jgi:hypothetical protein